jgi:erythromycin esterase-like protein
MDNNSSLRKNPMPVYSTLDEWIKQEATAFSLDSPTSLNAAVDRLMALLDPSLRLLGLGEALHGGEEILRLRNRLFQRLVEEHGFSAIALESSFPLGRAVNDYVAGHGPSSFDALREAGFSHGFGRLEANRELVEWMKEYNADEAHRVKLRFYGFDSPTEMMFADSPRQVIHFVLDFLASVDSTGRDEERQQIDRLLGQDSSWENPAAMMDPEKSIGLTPDASALRIEVEDLIAELHVRRPELVGKSNEGRYLEAAHYATQARMLLNYHAALARRSEPGRRIAQCLGLRDAMMADNLAYAVRCEQGRESRGKVLAFAHNSHLKLGKAEWQLGSFALSWWPAGAHLSQVLGSKYAVIGTAVGVSPGNGIVPPEADTLEARLLSVPGPVRLIATERGRALADSEMQALAVRSASALNSTYFPLTAQSFTDFDALAVLDRTEYSRGGPELPGRG